MEMLIVVLLLLFFVLPFVAIGRTFGLSREVEELRRQVRELQQALSAVQDRVARSEPPTVRQEQAPSRDVREDHEEPRAPREPEIQKATQPAPEFPEPVVRPAPAPQTPPVQPTVVPPQRPAPQAPPVWREIPAPEPARQGKVREGRTSEQWEMLLGGNWFNRIGAVALLVGFGFLLKYAFDQHWITPWMLVSAGIALGIGLLATGAYFRKKQAQVFAQGLVGAGIAILYLSVYASFNVYHLVGQMWTLAMMSAVTIAAIAQSLTYDSVAVVLIGLLGGFLTPAILQGGGAGGNGSGLFIYLALLDTGLLVVALEKDKWAFIDPLALACTYITYVVWSSSSYSESRMPVALTFIIVVWAIFCAADVYRNAASTATHTALRAFVATFNALFSYLAIYCLIDPHHHEWMGFATLMQGAVYGGVAYALRDRLRRNHAVIPRYVTTAIVLLAVATAVQLHGYMTVAAWAVEGAALVWCGTRWSAGYAWGLGALLLAVAAFKMAAIPTAFGYEHVKSFVAVLNERFVAYIALTGGFGASAVLLGRDENGFRGVCARLFHYSWIAVLFGLLTVEVNDYILHLMALGSPGMGGVLYPFAKTLVIAAIWLVYGLSLFMAGIRRRYRTVVIGGLAVFALGALTAAIQVLGARTMAGCIPFLNLRGLVLGTVIAGLLVAQWWLGRHRDRASWAGSGIACFLFGAAWVGFELLTVEISTYFREFGGHGLWLDYTDIGLAKWLVLASVWMAYSLVLAWFGHGRGSRPLAYSGLCIASLALGFAAVRGYEFEPLTSFTPVLNLRTAMFILIGLGIVTHHKLLADAGDRYAWSERALQVMQFLVVWLGFELVSVEVSDYFLRVMTSRRVWYTGISAEMARWMVMGTVWALYSMVVTWIGNMVDSRTLRYSGLAMAILGTIVVAANGYRFQPVAEFTPLLNLRSLAFAAVISALLAHQLWLGRRRSSGESGAMIAFLQIAASALAFQFVTTETHDCFARAMSQGGAMAGTVFRRLSDFRQSAYSVVWLVYSIALMTIGIWRRLKTVRLVAIGVFYFTIAKVFFYDLASLETLYRIFSFMGLGLILLATSYLYQRYRSLIVGPTASAEPPVPDGSANEVES